MISEEKLREAFSRIREDISQLNWKMIKVHDQLDDLSKEVRKLGGDTETPILERPLIERDTPTPKSTPKPSKKAEEPKAPEPSVPVDDEEEFY
tara:strand:+ start:347 stop:625 length:279 start_codon:yes stop_codon:yes gene_type:complete